MTLTEAQVRHVAKLARLTLTDAEVAKAQGDLARVLEAVQALDGLDLSAVPPTVQVHPQVVAPEADAPEAPLGVERALANAPAKVGTSFSVPRVIG
ncbi:MAG: Asp-tRNA(Asn)/Glu-tRNA(Gln) amidotransferase subunit GatC [Myxococcaceae bacterium]|nr:Asp-tRNA(Asn)/Glu-tRNA(Gln) amidotransferase subunit GatC [Myxococcaceae bacterium]